MQSKRNDDTKFVVDLDHVWEWLGFSKKDKAKNVLLKNFEKDHDYVVWVFPRARENSLGGRPKEQIFMNVETFKGLCMLANTEKGKQTRRYYTKMETIFFKYLEEKQQTLTRTLEYDFKRQKLLEIQQKLLQANKNTPLVYILKLEEVDEKNFVIKIGETDDIETRLASLRQEYKDCILIDAFPCYRPHRFEQYILKRKDVQIHKFASSEKIQISEEFPYAQLLKIIKKNISNFDGLSPHERLEIEKSKERQLLLQNMTLIHSTTDPVLKQQLLDIIKQCSVGQPNNIASSLHESPESDDSDSEESIDTTPYRNRQVYQYDPANLTTPIKTFNSLREAARSLQNRNIHDYHIRNASNSNTICEGYRWFYLDEDVNTPPAELPPTVQEPQTTPRNTGRIAQINKEKTKIINVFPNQKEAEKATNILNSQISTGIASGKLKNGFYWMLYENCADELKNTFTGTLPQPKRPSTCSKIVQRIDPKTNEVLETYHCIQDICKAFKCCHKSIHKANESSDIFKGFKWNIIDTVG